MPLKTHLDETPTINLTPMIDVVFLLIIFFMVGTKFSELERKIALNVPEVGKENATATVPRSQVVSVYRDGRIALNGEELSRGRLVNELAAVHKRSPTTAVIIRGDAEGAFQYVADVLSACREAGINDLGISVRMARHATAQRTEGTGASRPLW